MEDKWKEFFEKSKLQFRNEFELPKGHEERFLQKLNEQESTKKKVTINYWKIAAVLIPICMLSIYFVLEFDSESKPTQVNLADYSPELGEAENYFAYMIKEKVKEVKALENPENKKLVDHSLNELDALQKNYTQLLKDLKQSGGNPQVIKSVMTNLQLQIEVLESVLNQIEIKQEIKQTSDENIF
ncbi:hypothetical protein SAMN06296427_105160 [Moheibacter sediminis]|uniref:Anti-sigma factor n=2 Tax=Moheibacter sediminis TaxID=1434700 RepID=A0A1W2AZ60_9FLAO|nr:hypothetical protein SAMN06296427_105160 [Moheibacter sediminis]